MDAQYHIVRLWFPLKVEDQWMLHQQASSLRFYNFAEKKKQKKLFSSKLHISVRVPFPEPLQPLLTSYSSRNSRGQLERPTYKNAHPLPHVTFQSHESKTKPISFLIQSMPKIHPNASLEATESDSSAVGCRTAVFTVWRKSLLFNGNGFTVFDSKGNIVFRVDNYGSWRRRDVLLMDAVGNPLLTIRRKWRLTLEEQWFVYDGEEERVNPKFHIKKHRHIFHQKSRKVIADVNMPCDGHGGSGRKLAYEVEGSYADHCCSVHDERLRTVAEIKRKEAVGDDVFRLEVGMEFDPADAMAVVVVLDQMFGSSRLKI